MEAPRRHGGLEGDPRSQFQRSRPFRPLISSPFEDIQLPCVTPMFIGADLLTERLQVPKHVLLRPAVPFRPEAADAGCAGAGPTGRAVLARPRVRKAFPPHESP